MLKDLPLEQIMIAATGLIALTLLTFGGRRARLIAPWFGLASQPFWIAAAIHANQLGILVVSGAYTLVWLASCIKSLLTLRRGGAR
jgi:hypothetical protein